MENQKPMKFPSIYKFREKPQSKRSSENIAKTVSNYNIQIRKQKDHYKKDYEKISNRKKLNDKEKEKNKSVELSLIRKRKLHHKKEDYRSLSTGYTISLIGNL